MTLLLRHVSTGMADCDVAMGRKIGTSPHVDYVIRIVSGIILCCMFIVLLALDQLRQIKVRMAITQLFRD